MRARSVWSGLARGREEAYALSSDNASLVTVEPVATGVAQVEELLAGAELDLRLGRLGLETCDRLRHVAGEAATPERVRVRAAVVLGLAAYAEGDAPEAILRLTDAIAGPDISCLTHPDVFSALGKAYMILGAPERAAELFECCLEEVAAAGPDASILRLRYATQLSYSLCELGDPQRARTARTRDPLRTPMTSSAPIGHSATSPACRHGQAKRSATTWPQSHYSNRPKTPFISPVPTLTVPR